MHLQEPSLLAESFPLMVVSRFSFKLGSLAHTTFALFSKSDSGKVDRYSISDQKGTYFSLICLHSLFEFWRLYLKLFLLFFFLLASFSCFCFVFRVLSYVGSIYMLSNQRGYGSQYLLNISDYYTASSASGSGEANFVCLLIT